MGLFSRVLPNQTGPAALEASSDKEDPSSLFDLMGELDACFDEIVQQEIRLPSGSVRRAVPIRDEDLSEVHQLFGSLAAQHMTQVRDFLLDVKTGEATRDWLGICGPAVASLQRAAEGMGLTELGTALTLFAGVLRDVEELPERVLGSVATTLILEAYEPLVRLLPDAFALEAEGHRREAIILHALLHQIPGMGKVTLYKLYAAGLSSLPVLFLVRPDDLAVTTGLQLPLAQRIVEKIQNYRKELRNAVPDATRSLERRQLAALGEELRRQQEIFQAYEQRWSPEAEQAKRDLRHRRNDTYLQINVLLARLGEIQAVRSLERLPFPRRASWLLAYLEETTASPGTVA